MTDCTVTCRQCRSYYTGQPKTWKWLCETCAEDCLERHRRTSGHTDIALTITTEYTADSVTQRINDRRAQAAAWRNYWKRTR